MSFQPIEYRPPSICSIEGWGAAAFMGALAVAGVAGAAISAGGAEAAASQQAGAAENAQQISANEFNTITSQEAPFMQAGAGALPELEYGLGYGSKTPPPGGANGMAYGSLTTPFTTANWQQLSPAYNFQKEQGGAGVLNSEGPGEGALSGSALKDITAYNQGLASTSFGNAFNMFQTQQSNIFGRLSGVAGLGSSAAANLGAQGTQLAGQQAQSAQNIGTAQAGGTVGAANAIGGSLSSLPWLYMASQQSPPNNQGAGYGGTALSPGE